MTTPRKKRMYGMLYRARRKGGNISTRHRTIYYPYDAPPPLSK